MIDPLIPELPTPPRGWELVAAQGRHPTDPDDLGGAAYVNRDSRLKVIRSKATYSDGDWVHVSLSRPNRLPTWGDLKLVKQAFLGDVTALQILPKASNYVNIHPFCLHLWYCCDGERVPDFQKIKGQI